MWCKSEGSSVAPTIQEWMSTPPPCPRGRRAVVALGGAGMSDPIHHTSLATSPMTPRRGASRAGKSGSCRTWRVVERRAAGQAATTATVTDDDPNEVATTHGVSSSRSASSPSVLV